VISVEDPEWVSKMMELIEKTEHGAPDLLDQMQLEYQSEVDGLVRPAKDEQLLSTQEWLWFNSCLMRMIQRQRSCIHMTI